MSTLNLPVSSLEFKDLRQGFIDFLKSDPTYKDYNFEASGISTQMNLLAYNAHLIGYYVKMLLDESFVDSAHTRPAQLSHAKKTGYIAKGRRAARAEVELKISMDVADVPQNDSVLVPRGTSFASSNTAQDTRVFQIPEDVIAKTRTQVGSTVTYSTGPLVIYEGLSLDWRFLVDGSVVNQRFVIKDPNIDLDTLRVNVRQGVGSSEVTQFNLAKYTDEITGSTPVFYISTNEDGLYQIFFGNNIFGLQPSNGNLIEVTYVGTNGLSGNGAKNFQFNAPAADLTQEYHVGNFDDFEVVTNSVSSGGMEPETVDEMRFTIPHHWRRQNRTVTASDFKSLLIDEFRNVESVNVWGGEKHWQREYGKVFASIKPRNALFLTSASKTEIREALLERFGVVGADIVFVDPEYLNVQVLVWATVDRKKTNKNQGEIEADILQRTAEYGAANLGRFGLDLIDLDLANACKADDQYIVSIYTDRTISKAARVIYGGTGTNVLTYSNEITPGTVVSDPFTYGGALRHFKDDSMGNLWMYSADGTMYLASKWGTVDYAKGTIQFTFPGFARVPGFDGPQAPVSFTATPVSPDVKTELNNIVRITSTRVNFR